MVGKLLGNNIVEFMVCVLCSVGSFSLQATDNGGIPPPAI